MKVSLLLAFLLVGCAPMPKYPGPYCGLVCNTHQVCEWENCKGAVQTVASR